MTTLEQVARAIWTAPITGQPPGKEVRAWPPCDPDALSETIGQAQAAIAAIPDADRIAELEEALADIARADGKGGGEFIDWQRCVDRIQGIARAALQGARTGASASAPVDTASAPPLRTDRG